MNYRKYKFSQQNHNDFVQTLHLRVDEYFQNKGLSKHHNLEMVLKTAFVFSLYTIPYFILIFGNITSSLLALSLWGIMGWGMASIGLCIMHDSAHGAYSNKRWVNDYLGYSLNFIGGNVEVWKLQHNVLHHSYTNIEGIDDDIDTPFFLRFSPHKEKNWLHKFQFLYFWFFYGISTIFWVTGKEFAQIQKYKKMGLIRNKKKANKLLQSVILWKIFYYSYILVIPALVLPFSFGFILLSFLLMHFVAGTILSFIFQTAHVMPECEYPLPDEKGKMDNAWVVHEMLTTSNYAPSSKVFTWFVGGLNFQIEHHLFPRVCHVHYRHISKIVASTAKEYGVPYNSQTSFIKALWVHFGMLYKLGRMEKPVTKEMKVA